MADCRVAHLILVGAPAGALPGVSVSGVSGEHAPGTARWGWSCGQGQDPWDNSIPASHAPSVSHPRDDSSSLSLGSIWSEVSRVPRWRKGRRTVTPPPHAGRMASGGEFSHMCRKSSCLMQLKDRPESIRNRWGCPATIAVMWYPGCVSGARGVPCSEGSLARDSSSLLILSLVGSSSSPLELVRLGTSGGVRLVDLVGALEPW